MKNTQKDRRDKKLLRFLKELEGHNFLISDIDSYEKWRHEIYKRYGFTEDDWHKAVRLVMSIGNKDQYWDGVHNAYETIDLENGIEDDETALLYWLNENYYTSEEWANQDWVEEAFDQTYTTDSGEKIVAFGYYGRG